MNVRGVYVAGTGLGLLLLALAAAALVAAPAEGAARGSGPFQSGPVEPDLFALHQLPGTVVARGQAGQPAGVYSLTSYRVEELALPVPVRVTIGGQTVAADRAWRVVVTGGPFPVRALPPVLWIDGVVVGIGHESPDLTEIAAIVFDRSQLHDGATIALSYGWNADQRVELPERLAIGDLGDPSDLGD